MTDWRKSSKCESHNCVEVALGREVRVRDSADVRVVFTREAWRRFVAAVPQKEER